MLLQCLYSSSYYLWKSSLNCCTFLAIYLVWQSADGISVQVVALLHAMSMTTAAALSCSWELCEQVIILKHAIFDAVSLCSFHFSNLVFEAPILQILMHLHNLYRVECWCLFLLGVELFSSGSTKYFEWDPAALGEKIKGNWLGFTPFQSHGVLKTGCSAPLAKCKTFLGPAKLGSPPWLPTWLSWLELGPFCYFWTALKQEYYY